MTKQEQLQTKLEIIGEKFSEAIISVTRAVDTAVVTIRKESLLEFGYFLRDDPRLKFDYLSFMTAVDYPKRAERFDVVYQLYSVDDGTSLRIKVPAALGEEVDSAIPVWNTAVLVEMEIFDMFGIVFKGHPDMRRIYMADDWKGHPLRKDYPLKGYRR